MQSKPYFSLTHDKKLLEAKKTPDYRMRVPQWNSDQVKTAQPSLVLQVSSSFSHCFTQTRPVERNLTPQAQLKCGCANEE